MAGNSWWLKMAKMPEVANKQMNIYIAKKKMELAKKITWNSWKTNEVEENGLTWSRWIKKLDIWLTNCSNLELFVKNLCLVFSSYSPLVGISVSPPYLYKKSGI